MRSLFSRRLDVARLQTRPVICGMPRPMPTFAKGWWGGLFRLASDSHCWGSWRNSISGGTNEGSTCTFHSIGGVGQLACLQSFRPTFHLRACKFLRVKNSFFISKQASSFPLPFFLSRLSSSASLRLPPSSGPEVLVTFGDFIEKVGGRIM